MLEEGCQHVLKGVQAWVRTFCAKQHSELQHVHIASFAACWRRNTTMVAGGCTTSRREARVLHLEPRLTAARWHGPLEPS